MESYTQVNADDIQWLGITFQQWNKQHSVLKNRTLGLFLGFVTIALLLKHKVLISWTYFYKLSKWKYHSDQAEDPSGTRISHNSHCFSPRWVVWIASKTSKQFISLSITWKRNYFSLYLSVCMLSCLSLLCICSEYAELFEIPLVGAQSP